MTWLDRWRPQHPESQTDVSVHFFRNYNRLIGAAYAFILLGLVVFFGFQLRERFGAEVALIESNVKRHSQFVEYVIRSSLDQLDNLQMLVIEQNHTANTPKAPGRPPAHWPPFVAHQSGAEKSFSLDKATDIDLTGNIVGDGSLVGRSADFYADMEQALLLNASMRSLIFTLPNAARARFLATEQFLLTSPWRPSPAIGFGPHV
jgi:sigma-B regulation protein RsbU (phosphoserine phosphatase)